jgi:hypothetical protein
MLASQDASRHRELLQAITLHLDFPSYEDMDKEKRINFLVR